MNSAALEQTAAAIERKIAVQMHVAKTAREVAQKMRECERMMAEIGEPIMMQTAHLQPHATNAEIESDVEILDGPPLPRIAQEVQEDHQQPSIRQRQPAASIASRPSPPAIDHDTVMVDAPIIPLQPSRRNVTRKVDEPMRQHERVKQESKEQIEARAPAASSGVELHDANQYAMSQVRHANKRTTNRSTVAQSMLLRSVRRNGDYRI
ncbi:MAG: hypothetical protein Q7T57_00240 [Dehalococcoidales bacterium]|nr:hypothetical protein [Dehalococcoidales bacterium]